MTRPVTPEQPANPIHGAQASADYVNSIGGLPEISSAAVGLRNALAQTRAEIDEAILDPERFPAADPNGADLQRIRNYIMPSVLTVMSMEREGIAGYKRSQLLSDYREVENLVNLSISRLVALRADLRVSQSDFKDPLETVD